MWVCVCSCSITADVVVVLKSSLLTLVNALWTNVNYQWTTVFSLTNVNKDG